MLASAQPLLTSLRQSVVLIDGRSVLDDPSLSLAAQAGGKSGKKDAVDKPLLSVCIYSVPSSAVYVLIITSVQARILVPASSFLTQPTGVPLLRVTFEGATHLVAVMPADVTLGEAQMALRVDAVRSMSSRLAVLAESIEDEHEDDPKPPAHQRSGFKLLGCFRDLTRKLFDF